MTKSKISISTNRSFGDQQDAREYLKKLVDSGVLYIKCFYDRNKTTIQVDEITYYKTQTDAKIGLKKFVDAGILYLEVERDFNNV